MTGICFFLTVFCGIFGACILIKLLYDTAIDAIKKRKIQKCPNKRKSSSP